METSSGPPSQKPKVTVAAPVPTTQLDPSAAKEESRQGRPTPDAAAPDVLIPRAGKRGTRIGGASPLDSKNPSFVDEKREEAEDRQNESLAKDTPDLESKEGAGFRFWQPAYFWFWFMITSLVLVSTSRCALSFCSCACCPLYNPTILTTQLRHEQSVWQIVVYCAIKATKNDCEHGVALPGGKPL